MDMPNATPVRRGGRSNAIMAMMTGSSAMASTFATPALMVAGVLTH